MSITVLVTMIILAPSDKKLYNVGAELRVRSIQTGEIHPEFQKLAEEHAANQARLQHQGHFGWEQRVAILKKKVPEVHEWKEVVGESHPNQDMDTAAREMYRSWRLSREHWAAVNGYCNYYGCSMRLGTNNVWYACIIFGIKHK